jgi:hypothetical protein
MAIGKFAGQKVIAVLGIACQQAIAGILVVVARVQPVRKATSILRAVRKVMNFHWVVQMEMCSL